MVMVFCAQCGLQDQEDGTACVACGAVLQQEAVTSRSSLPPPIPLQQPVPLPGDGAGAVAVAPVEYAGFWLRAVAAVIDFGILLVVYLIIAVIVGIVVALCNVPDTVID